MTVTLMRFHPVFSLVFAIGAGGGEVASSPRAIASGGAGGAPFAGGPLAAGATYCGLP